MSATITAPAQPKIHIKRRERPLKRDVDRFVERENASTWPLDLIEAYARPPGPYTIENAETILEEEPIELYNGWLVWQEMTNFIERRVVANINDMLSVPARKMGFGQILPDQVECLLKDGTVIKPDTSLISWQRVERVVTPKGPRDRPTLVGCPELVVEARSPSNRRIQEKRTRKLYFANHTQIVWDVDEINREIWVYRAELPEEPTHFGMDDEIDCEPLLPNWRRRVADIFAAEVSAETVLGEVVDEFRNEGKIEGIEIGKADGAAQALRSVLPLLVRVRFGVQPPVDLPQRLQRRNLTQLEQLQNAVETCATIEQWLALLPTYTDALH